MALLSLFQNCMAGVSVGMSMSFPLVAAAIFLFSKADIAQKELTQAKATQQLFEQKVKEKGDLIKLSSELSRQSEALRWVDAGYPSLS